MSLDLALGWLAIILGTGLASSMIILSFAFYDHLNSDVLHEEDEDADESS